MSHPRCPAADCQDSAVEAELKTGDVLYREPQTHWVENIGTTPLHFLVTELKSPG